MLEIPKQNAEKVLESYIGHYPIRDIGIEEEEIGSVVERIYKGGVGREEIFRNCQSIHESTANLEWSDTFVDVILAVSKILFAWILWSILFEGKKQIAGLGFQTMISYYIISVLFIPVGKIC